MKQTGGRKLPCLLEKSLPECWVRRIIVNEIFVPCSSGVVLINMKINNKGFTLAEVILAAAILVFALAGLLALFISCMLLNESSRNRATAIACAQYVMEEIKNTDFDNIEDSITTGNWDWDESEIAANDLPVLRNEAVDTAVSDSGDPLGVLVTVSWQDRLGASQTISLSTIFTDVF